MNEVELLKVYGLEPDQKHCESIRQLLCQEIEEPEGEDNEVLKLLCIMLFAVGNVEDTELIWLAKRKIRTRVVILMFSCFVGLAWQRLSFILKISTVIMHTRNGCISNNVSHMTL